MIKSPGMHNTTVITTILTWIQKWQKHQKVSAFLGMGGKKRLENGRTWGTRLGSSAPPNTSIATFSADGTDHLSSENHLVKTMQCVLDSEPMLERQQGLFSPGPHSHRVLVSNTDTHTPRSETTGFTGAAKPDVEKSALCLGRWSCIQGQGGNRHSTTLLNPCI